MKKIVEIKFGSHLYGTSTPASDLDIKGIYLPSAEDILLQQVTPTININRAKAQGEKNTAEDIDLEMFTPARFLQLVAEGQTIALLPTTHFGKRLKASLTSLSIKKRQRL